MADILRSSAASEPSAHTILSLLVCARRQLKLGAAAPEATVTGGRALVGSGRATCVADRSGWLGGGEEGSGS